MTHRQSEAFQSLIDVRDLEILYGGAKGGGKSYLFCIWVMIWMDKLIEFFGLKPTKNPIPLGFIGRKQSVDFSHTTLETFKREIPPEIYRIKTQEKEIIFRERAKVFYGGLDDRQRIQKFNSAEFAFFGIDQAEETERVDLEVLQAALRFKIGDKVPPYKALFTANPADCWLKEDFIDNDYPDKVYIPALPTDNPHLPGSYVQRLKNVFRHNEPMLKAYLHGDWYSLKSSNSLISAEMLNILKNSHKHPTETKRIIVCDPSLGGDECVINYMENCDVKDMKILVNERDTLKIGAEMVVMGEKYGVNYYAADCIGIGNGAINNVKRLLKERRNKAGTLYIDSSENASDKARFKNVRAEMCWYAMEQIQEKLVPWPKDEETRRQLINIRFKVIDSNGKIQIEKTVDIKKRIGQSPDRAMNWIMGVWATKHAPAIQGKDAWRPEQDSDQVVSAVTSAMAA